MTNDMVEKFRDLVEKLGGEVFKEDIHQNRPRLWVKVDYTKIKEIFLLIRDNITIPHLSTIIGEDLGDSVHIMYPINVYDDSSPQKCFYAVISIEVPKNNLVIDSISDILNVAWIYEAEVSEILGVTFRGLVKKGRYYIPDTLPEGIIMREDKQDELVKYVSKAEHPLEGDENGN